MVAMLDDQRSQEAPCRSPRLDTDPHGVIQYPSRGKYALPGRLALRSTQIEMACQWLDFELGRDKRGQLYVSDPFHGEWVPEDEMFKKLMPMSKIETLLLSDRYPVSVENFNEVQKRWFEYWCDRLERENFSLKRGRKITILPIVASILEIDIESIDD